MRLNAYPANEITANLFKDEVLHLLYFMYHHKEKIPQLRWKALHEVTSLLVSDKFNHPSHQGSAGAWYFHDPLKKLETEVCENSNTDIDFGSVWNRIENCKIRCKILVLNFSIFVKGVCA